MYFYIFIVTILTLLLAMCNAKTNKDRQMKDNPVFENFFLAIGKYLEISNSLIATRIKLMCRSQQFLQRPAVLLGGAITWSVVGGCAALLSHTDSVKVFYLVLTLCIYMLTYFLSTLLFDDLSSQFSFDSDGRQLSLFILQGSHYGTYLHKNPNVFNCFCAHVYTNSARYCKQPNSC